jgi:polyhydroxybutyrate depolymerase
MRDLGRLAVVLIVLGWLSGFDPAAFAAERNGRFAGQRQTLIHDGIGRSYLIRLPPGLGPHAGRVPLVLVLHGGGGNADNAEQMTGFTGKAGKEAFIVVYPEGTGRLGNRLLTWNAGHCCGYAMDHRVDDVGFIGALLDRLVEDYPVDPRRIYVTGMSNGGMMTHRLGIELPHRFAAIAPVVASLFGDEIRPAQPVSALMLNGMLDVSVPHRGGAPGGRFPNAWDGTPVKPALDQAAFWAEANGCDKAPGKHDRGPFIVWQYRCPAGRAVESYLIKDSGHAWPGGKRGSRRGDDPGSSVNGTDVIWAFFEVRAR